MSIIYFMQKVHNIFTLILCYFTCQTQSSVTLFSVRMLLTGVWSRAFLFLIILGFFAADLDEPQFIIIIIFTSASSTSLQNHRSICTRPAHIIEELLLFCTEREKPCTEWIKHLTISCSVWDIWLCVCVSEQWKLQPGVWLSFAHLRLMLLPCRQENHTTGKQNQKCVEKASGNQAVMNGRCLNCSPSTHPLIFRDVWKYKSLIKAKSTLCEHANTWR